MAISNSKVKFKFCAGDQVRINKSRRAFKNGYLPNWTEEIFTISKRITKELPILIQADDDSGEIL